MYRPCERRRDELVVVRREPPPGNVPRRCELRWTCGCGARRRAGLYTDDGNVGIDLLVRRRMRRIGGTSDDGDVPATGYQRPSTVEDAAVDTPVVDEHRHRPARGLFGPWANVQR